MKSTRTISGKRGAKRSRKAGDASRTKTMNGNTFARIAEEARKWRLIRRYVKRWKYTWVSTVVRKIENGECLCL